MTTSKSHIDKYIELSEDMNKYISSSGDRFMKLLKDIEEESDVGRKDKAADTTKPD